MPDARSLPALRSPPQSIARTTRRWIASPLGGACAALLLALPGCGSWMGGGSGAAPAGPPARTVQIQRSPYGVPQIQAADLEALAYGVAYAQAQESFCETADQLVTVRGERSAWFGAEGTTQLGGQRVNNLQLDIFVRALMEDGELALAHRDTSADARALSRGYVEGYNRYLADHGPGAPAPLRAACAGQPWLQPMTVYDYRRLGELQARQAGSLPLLPAVLAARMPDPGAASLPGVPAVQAARELAGLGLNDAGVGGTAWAMGAEVAPEGGGLLLAQMHGPWSGSSRWRQMRLTVPGQLDVQGARMGPGVPVQVGFNADFAWSHTQSAARHATLFELKLVPGDPARYLVSGLAERMRARTVSVEVRRPDGRMENRLHTVWMTRYGPVVVLPQAGLHWTAQTAYALQDANAWNARGTETWLALGQARSVGAAQVALQRLGTPWMATVAVDRHGDTLFQDASSVPDVDAAQLKRCAPSKPAAALLGAAGLVVLDGSRGDCAWRADAASARPGLTPASRLPTLERRDWVQSADDGYWLTNPALALGGLSPLAGPAEAPLQLRTRASLQLIQQGAAVLAGSPLQGGEVLVKLRELFEDHRNQAAQLVLDDLLAACEPVAAPASSTAPGPAGPAPARNAAAGGRTVRAAPAPAAPQPPSAAARQACAVLAAWDRRDDAASRGAWLFRLWWREARDLPNLWRVPFDAKDPLNTPAGLRTADPKLRSRLLALLEQAAARVQAGGLVLDVALGEVQNLASPAGPLARGGGDDTAGVLVQARGPWEGAAVVPGGTAMLMAVGFGPGGQVAQGLVVPGQSADPASPHAFDGLQAWLQGRWPELSLAAALPPADKAASAASKVTQGPAGKASTESSAEGATRPVAPVLVLSLPPAEAASAPPLPKGLLLPPQRAASAAAAASSPTSAPAPLPVPTIRRPEPGASAPVAPSAPESRVRGR